VGDTNSALIGFTAATGGVSANQYIANFVYRPLPTLTASLVAGNVVLTWPTGAGIDGFTFAVNDESKLGLVAGVERCHCGE